MSTRRQFVRHSAAGFGIATIAPSFLIRCASKEVRDLAHRLFFDADDLARMRTVFETDAAFTSLRDRLNAVDRTEMREFIQNEVKYNDQLFHIVRLSDTAQEMAFHYLLTGDRDAADLSAECIRSIMKFDKWDYFLEAGTQVVGIQRASSTLTAVAVCSDWLGEFITTDERSDWIEVMKERGCEPCFRSLYGMRYPEEVVGWTRDEESTYFEHRPGDRPTDLSQRHIILDSTNLKAVPASALAIGAVACQQHEGVSDDTTRWLEQAVYSLRTFGDFFAPDGSYHEGVSYANYTALNIIKATSILSRFDVADLTALINWSGYADFAVGMAMPTEADPYEIVNFGDNGNTKSGGAGKPKRTAVSLWIANTFDVGRAQWFGLNLGGEHDEWALIWYDPAIEEDPAPDGVQLWHSDLDWIVARAGFNPDDLTVAMRSGGPGNHEHADRNSIIIKCHGEQIVADPYRPPYSFTDPAWMMRTTAGHSAVLIDGKGHQYHDGREGTNPSDARAKIISKNATNSNCTWTSDATKAYQLVMPDVRLVLRSVMVLFDWNTVIIFDKVVKDETASTIEARFFGFNHDKFGRVYSGGDTFVMSRPLGWGYGQVWSKNGVAVESEFLPIPEEEAAKHPFASVVTQDASLEMSLLTSIAIAPGTTQPPKAVGRIDNGVYQIELAHDDGRSVNVDVDESGNAPTFDVRS